MKIVLNYIISHKINTSVRDFSEDFCEKILPGLINPNVLSSISNLEKTNMNRYDVVVNKLLHLYETFTSIRWTAFSFLVFLK